MTQIEARSAAARGAPTYDRAREIARKIRGQKQGRWFFGTMGVLFLASSVFLL